MRPSEFELLSSADQRHYLRTVAEHLAEMTRIHAEVAHPRVVGRPKPLDEPS